MAESIGATSWMLGDLDRLRRFLCLGLESGTYYCTAEDPSPSPAGCVQRLIEDGRGAEVVDELAAVVGDGRGRAVRRQPALIALAQCARCDRPDVRRLAYSALPRVCPDPSALFRFVELAETFRGWAGAGTGWGSAQRRALDGWYNAKPPAELVRAVTKDRCHNGWTHRDVLRLAHVNPNTEATGLVLKYLVKGWKCLSQSGQEEKEKEEETAKRLGRDGSYEEVLAYLKDLETVRRSGDPVQVACLVEKNSLTWQHLPTQYLKSQEVWTALLPTMPLSALLGSLGRLTATELLGPLTSATGTVCERLRDGEGLRAARLHPVHLLASLCQYRRGKGLRGRLRWSPVPLICEALDVAFYNSFQFVEATGKRFMVCLDVSATMNCSGVNGIPSVMAREASAAMAMVAMRTETEARVMAFSETLAEAGLSAEMKLDEVVKTLGSIGAGKTDCALPMLYAKERKIPVDVFVVFTDNDTTSGAVDPASALRDYRAAVESAAKLVVVGLSANSFAIAPPDSSVMLDIAGFDADCPDVIRNFALDLI